MRRGTWLLSALCLVAPAFGAVGEERAAGNVEEVRRVAHAERFARGTDGTAADAVQRRELAALGRALAAEARALEAAGRLHEADHAWRSALAVDVELGSDRPVVEDLAGLARVADSLGRAAEAHHYRELARRLSGGSLTASALAAVAAPLACDGAGHDKTPNAADIPKGKWNGFGYGSTQAEAVASVLDQLFGNICMPTCKDVCPDGDPPGPGQCDPDARAKQPVSTTGSDYGATRWDFKTLTSGKILLTAKGISKFPQGLTVTQKCTSCETADAEPGEGDPASEPVSGSVGASAGAAVGAGGAR